MIRAIDLRIGNWVNIPGKGLTKIVDGKSLDLLVEQGAEGIPITEELLKQLGFIKLEETTLYEIKASDFRYDIGSQRIGICHPGNQFWHWLTSHIRYVHQLQNIFYCIIGHDLTL